MSIEPNPYNTPPPLVINEEVILAEPAFRPFRLPEKPQIWPVFVVAIGAVLTSVVVSSIVFLGMMVWDIGPRPLLSTKDMEDWLATFSKKRLGLAALVLPGQMVFFGSAVVAACWSPLGIGRRLSLFAGQLPLWSWILFALGTPMIGMASSAVLTQFVRELSPQMEMMHEMFRAHGADSFLLVVLLVAVVPGIAEEALFRGYIQSRLLKRWPPVVAVGFTSIIFAIAHLDPMHMVGVLPLGLWLGVLAWRSGSIWPSVICHVTNNALAIAVTQLMEKPTDDLPLTPVMGAGMLASIVALGASLLVLWLAPQRKHFFASAPAASLATDSLDV